MAVLSQAAIVRAFPLALAIACGGEGAPAGGGGGDVGDSASSPDSGGDSGDDAGPVEIPDGAWILDNARVVDAAGVREGRAVVVLSDEIQAVLSAGGPWPDGVEIVDVGGASVLPGLIDAHVHLFHSGATWYVGETLERNLAAYLAWGVTGVADLGAPAAVFGLRDRLARGELKGPRVWATGPFLTAEGSHPCEVGYDRELCRFVSGDGRAAVSELAEADGVKVALADAAFSPWPTPRLDVGDLAEIVSAASDAEQRVVAHVDTPIDIADALAAGVQILAHPAFDAAGAVATDAVTMSTIGAFSGTEDLYSGALLAEPLDHTPTEVRAAWAWLSAHPEAWTDGWIRESAGWAGAARANVATSVAAGQPVLAGSDGGYWLVPHGLGLHRELEALVVAGMTPLQAIAAATSAPADAFGWADVGFVDVGYRADLLVVSGHPDQDIRATRDVLMVYQAGLLVVAGADSWAVAGDAACLDDRDCAADQACDPLSHMCLDACPSAFAAVNACGEGSFCLPADGIDSIAGVCHPGDECDLLAQDCAPASYGENCVPADLDTQRCWPSGPRASGQSCGWTDPALFCEQGLLCSTDDATCHAFCDPGDDLACAGCAVVRAGGEDWFGLCP